MKRRGLRFGGNLLPPETNQLINCRHPLKTPLSRAAAYPARAKTRKNVFFRVKLPMTLQTGPLTYQKEKKMSSGSMQIY
jgi:hypothetical protein